jgi:hypothetical protein
MNKWTDGANCVEIAMRLGNGLEEGCVHTGRSVYQIGGFQVSCRATGAQRRAWEVENKKAASSRKKEKVEHSLRLLVEFQSLSRFFTTMV